MFSIVSWRIIIWKPWVKCSSVLLSHLVSPFPDIISLFYRIFTFFYDTGNCTLTICTFCTRPPITHLSRSDRTTWVGRHMSSQNRLCSPTCRLWGLYWYWCGRAPRFGIISIEIFEVNTDEPCNTIDVPRYKMRGTLKIGMERSVGRCVHNCSHADSEQPLCLVHTTTLVFFSCFFFQSECDEFSPSFHQSSSSHPLPIIPPKYQGVLSNAQQEPNKRRSLLPRRLGAAQQNPGPCLCLPAHHPISSLLQR